MRFVGYDEDIAERVQAVTGAAGGCLLHGMAWAEAGAEAQAGGVLAASMLDGTQIEMEDVWGPVAACEGGLGLGVPLWGCCTMKDRKGGGKRSSLIRGLTLVHHHGLQSWRIVAHAVRQDFHQCTGYSHGRQHAAVDF